MDFVYDLLWGSQSLWGGGVAHSVLVLALTIALGTALGKIKVAGVSIGVTGILFVGIAMSHFGICVNEHILHFMKEFGLILFVYSIGLQVGPGFFASFRKGGLKLNQLAMIVILLGVVTTIALHYITGLPMTTMVGVMSGAVTNTPGLGAAQQAYTDAVGSGADVSEMATGYAVAYPLGVIGAILSLLLLRRVLRINVEKEEAQANVGSESQSASNAVHVSIEITNPSIDGMSVLDVKHLLLRDFVMSRISHQGAAPALVGATTILHLGDRVLVVSGPENVEPIVAVLGKRIEMSWEDISKDMISRRVVITKPRLNGRRLSDLHMRASCGVTITRVNRAGIDLLAAGNLQLQMGDRVTVVGPEMSVRQAEKLFGNTMKYLDHPNLIAIFIGIVFGVVLGSIPIHFPGIPQPVKLGLAGGPLIVAILIGRYGPQYKLVTYTTTSANLMLREVGISLFLAGVGLSAGESFVPTIVSGGYMWILYGAIITIVPLLVAGLIGRLCFKLNYFTLIGVLAGSSTNPPALAFSSDMTMTDAPAVGYATVYPLSMFLRVLAAQFLVLFFM